jgi:hypothetical protein
MVRLYLNIFKIDWNKLELDENGFEEEEDE